MPRPKAIQSATWCKNERRCERHARGSLEIPGHAKERAQAQETDQHEVIDEYGPDQDQDDVRQGSLGFL